MAAIVVCWLAASCTSGSPSPGVATDPARSLMVEVVDVIDGDTVVVRFGEQNETVRLLGIDTPETVHPDLPEQCFGAEAAAELGRILPPSTLVEVRRDDDIRDHYGRLLLYIYRADDGLLVNHWMVAQGLADVTIYEPNTALAAELTEARRQARRDNRGLWAACDGPDQPLS